MTVQFQSLNSPLGIYVVQRMTNATELQDSRARSCVRKGMEVIALGIVTSARLAMSMICLTGSAEILNRKVTDWGPLTMGTINAAGAIISFGCLSAFTKMKIIEVLTRYIPDSEQKLMSHDIGPKMRNLIKASSVFLGFSSQIPMGVGAYNAALFAPWYMGISTFLDGGRSSWSMYNTFMAAYLLRTEPKEGTAGNLVAAKKALVKQLGQYNATLALPDNPSSPTSVQTHPQRETEEQAPLLGGQSHKIDDQGSPANILGKDSGYDEGATELFQILRSTKTVPTKPPLGRMMQWGVNGAVVFMAGSVLAEFYRLGQDGASGITDNVVAQNLFATFVVGANLNLWFSLVSRTTEAAIKGLRGANPPSLTEKVAPTFYRRFTNWGTWASVPTFVPSVYFAKVYFPAYAYYPIAVLSSAAAFLGGLSALHGLRDILIRRLHSAHPDIVMEKKLEQIKATVDKTNLAEIARFLLELPEDLRQKFSKSSREDLEAYLNSSEQHSV